jgi:RsiW-degrading membrane proteinase PrsW (M82 family)
MNAKKKEVLKTLVFWCFFYIALGVWFYHSGYDVLKIASFFLFGLSIVNAVVVFLLLVTKKEPVEEEQVVKDG